MYNSKSGEYLSEAEKRNRQQHRDRVALSHQHKTRKREAAEKVSWQQLKSFNNGERDEA